MSQKKLTGSFVALITPFNQDGSVDFGAFRTLLKFHQDHGTSAVLIMGSTGETSMLSPRTAGMTPRPTDCPAEGDAPVVERMGGDSRRTRTESRAGFPAESTAMIRTQVESPERLADPKQPRSPSQRAWRGGQAGRPSRMPC